ncbi:unnamed protein product [Brassicogethes aeneus]|uniref:Major facilitator superfamily associated domain-containing protein n=1 Tax=Brassicogethes aeneus TaxID=1431903 RepID=A0A9P0FL67_BRAAE|nr:unnamed protein product [Brassicogethes aeneus]
MGEESNEVREDGNKAIATEIDDEVIEKQKWGINPNLIMLKLTLFVFYGATSSLVPYLTIHMQSIGLSMEQIALIYLSLPFTTFLAPPLTGYLVDKFGQYKPVVIVSFILTALLHHSLFLLPTQEIPGTVPSGYIIIHPKKMRIDIWWSPCPSRECPEQDEVDLTLDKCVDHCLLKNRKTWNITQTNPGIEDDLSFHLGKNKSNAWNLTLAMHDNLGDPIEQLGIEMDLPDEDDGITDIKKRFPERMLKRYGVDVNELDEQDLRCGGTVGDFNESTQTKLFYYSKDCILQKCEFRSGGPAVCPPGYIKSDDNTFWIYFCLRFVATVALTAGVTIMDPIALTMIEKFGGDFGKERLFSSLGMALFSPVTGALIDWNSKRLGHTDYASAFYTFDVLLFVAAIAVCLMPLGSKLPADNIFSDLMNIFKMPHLVAFIFFMFILGNLWGFIESYLFFYLRELGAPNILLGITVTVGTISSLPFLYGAENITKKIGHVNIIIVAFFAHAARLAGYSVIESAWWCFPFEAMESLSVHLMWVAAATYCAILAPKNLLATLIGVIGMAHFSIGRGTGSFFGGNIIGKFGIRQSFRLMAFISCSSGIAYALLYYFWLKKIEERAVRDDANVVENGEIDKLKDDEPKTRDVGTMCSFEKLDSRLSLVVEYNQIGSLTSLGRVRADGGLLRRRSISMRRESDFGPIIKKNSKTDLLKSAIEVNQSRNSIKASNNHINLLNGGSSASDKLNAASSTPKLSQRSASILQEKESNVLNEKDEIVYDEIKHKKAETEDSEES